MAEPEPFEINTGAEFQRKYPGYFEAQARNAPPIDPRAVPDGLRHLIPWAERWGITAASWLRIEFCEAATPEMAAAFKQALAGTHALYEDWIYTEPADDEPDPVRARSIRYAQHRFGAMYLAEVECFGGRGIRGFIDWYKDYDPEGYAEWVRG